MPSSVPLNVNGRATAVEVDDPDMPLLYALRNDLGLHGPRFGCGLGQCGSCTVHIDGEAVRSCITPLSSVAPGQRIVTLEGLGSPACMKRCAPGNANSAPPSTPPEGHGARSAWSTTFRRAKRTCCSRAG